MRYPTESEMARLVEDYFADRGEEVAYDPDTGLGKARGAEFSVHNVARHLGKVDRDEWSDFVAWHFDRLKGGPPELPTNYSEVRRRLRVRLASTDWVDQLPAPETARPVADDLHEVLMVSLHSAAATIPPDHLAMWGEDMEKVWRHARDNTMRDEPMERQRAIKPTGERFVWVRGGWWVASKLLDLGRYLSPRNSHGAIVMVPVRDALFYHEITDESVVNSLAAMLEPGLRFHFEDPDPVSPHVYWWRRDKIRRIAALENDRMNPVWGSEFSSVLAELDSTMELSKGQ